MTRWVDTGKTVTAYIPFWNGDGEYVPEAVQVPDWLFKCKVGDTVPLCWLTGNPWSPGDDVPDDDTTAGATADVLDSPPCVTAGSAPASRLET